MRGLVYSTIESDIDILVLCAVSWIGSWNIDEW